MQRPRPGQETWGDEPSSLDGLRAAMDRRILCALLVEGKHMRADELADLVGARLRVVVGRLQSLKREQVVAYKRNGSAPSAPGLWTITELGRQRIHPDTS